MMDKSYARRNFFYFYCLITYRTDNSLTGVHVFSRRYFLKSIQSIVSKVLPMYWRDSLLVQMGLKSASDQSINNLATDFRSDSNYVYLNYSVWADFHQANLAYP